MTKKRLIAIGIIAWLTLSVVTSGPAPTARGDVFAVQVAMDLERWHERMQRSCHIDLSVIEFDEGEAWYEPPECPGVVLWQDGIG